MNPPSNLSAELLDRLIPMGALRPETRRDLLRNSALIEVKAGSFLFRRGQKADKVLYLVQGRLELRDETGVPVARFEADSPEARHRLAHQSPRRLDAQCLTDVRCVAVDAHLLDVMLTWDQSDALEVGELGGENTCDSDDWMTRLLQTHAFQLVPPANLQAIFMRMERVDAVAGEVIVRQGESGDYFYVIIDGRCLVTREQPHQKAVRLAELDTGSCFGEEALISDSPRNATVTMLNHGSLMRLSKDDFRKLLNEPLTRRLPMTEAQSMANAEKAKFLDVRLPSEFANRNLPGSINLPLYMLRMRLDQLDKRMSYICVCDTGRRSSVASFVLMQKGFEAYTLAQGLDSHP